MDQQDDSLVHRRSRRSTAGNRMQAALAELANEDLLKEVDDDVDFSIQKEEDDVFESDFQSTEDEADQDDEEAAEKVAVAEEKRSRKITQVRSTRVTAAVLARQKATFNPDAAVENEAQHPPEKKIKRRVSLGATINAETGEVIRTSKRQSQRKHTVLNTSQTFSRMKSAEEKRAAIPKKVKARTPILMQNELISRALDTEEGNILEHRNYLELEEEKRRRARVVRTSISGPLLRWISKREEVTVGDEPVDLQLQSTDGSVPMTVDASDPLALKSDAGQAPQQRSKIVCKNYLVHEFSQGESSAKPPWKDTMEAMFGDHVKWDELRVFVGKGRPLARVKLMCPITGLTARYFDPRTGVPFANIRAYETLTRILAHEYEWSDNLGCYVSRDGFEGDSSRAKKRSRLP